MSEEGPTIEDLQKQILEMKEQREKDAAELTALKKDAEQRDADLKAARELNAKLMSGVPGDDGATPKAEDPYEGLSDMEILEKMSVELVDKVAAARMAKKQGA